MDTRQAVTTLILQFTFSSNMKLDHSFGNAAISAGGPNTWNPLPEHIRSVSTIVL